MLKALTVTDDGWHEVNDLDQISELLARDCLLWATIDVHELHPGEVDLISREFGLHPLAVEDAVMANERAKLDIFPEHFFAVVHELDEVGGQLEDHQIAAFIGKHFLLTIHSGADRTLEEGRQRWTEREQEFQPDPLYLAYAMLDVLVDDYQRIADDIESEIEDLEDAILDTLELPPRQRIARINDADTQRRLYSLKQQTSRLRRFALPVARVLGNLIGADTEGRVDSHLKHLAGDVMDHLKRVGDQVHNIDELDDALIQLRQGEQAAALNEVTKKLTAWAAIIAVPTLISGFYGMNFALIPSTGSSIGFWFAFILILITAFSLYVYFKRRHWL